MWVLTAALAALAAAAALAAVAAAARRHIAHGHVRVLGHSASGILRKAEAIVHNGARALERRLANIAARLQEVVQRRVDTAEDSLARALGGATSATSHSIYSD